MLELQSIEAYFDFHGYIPAEKQKRRREIMKKTVSVKKEK